MMYGLSDARAFYAGLGLADPALAVLCQAARLKGHPLRQGAGMGVVWNSTPCIIACARY